MTGSRCEQTSLGRRYPSKRPLLVLLFPGDTLSKPPSARIPLRVLLGSFLKAKDVKRPRAWEVLKTLTSWVKFQFQGATNLGSGSAGGSCPNGC